MEVQVATKTHRVLTVNIPWDVEQFELSPDGSTLAFITNEDGVGVLHLMDAQTGRELKPPKLPLGVPSGLDWHENSRDLAFTLSASKSPSDAWSLDVKTGKLERWTESETGGLNPENFVEPQLVKLKSFDGLPISAFLYRPDPKNFPARARSSSTSTADRRASRARSSRPGTIFIPPNWAWPSSTRTCAARAATAKPFSPSTTASSARTPCATLARS